MLRPLNTLCRKKEEINRGRQTKGKKKKNTLLSVNIYEWESWFQTRKKVEQISVNIKILIYISTCYKYLFLKRKSLMYVCESKHTITTVCTVVSSWDSWDSAFSLVTFFRVVFPSAEILIPLGSILIFFWY